MVIKAKIVKESLYEFVRGKDPKESLGLGRIGSIRKFFRDLNIPDNRYKITETGVIFNGYLDLEGTNITELPEGLSFDNSLDLIDTSLVKLPEDLSVKCNLYLNGTSITELPKGLSVGSYIVINKSQIQLKNHIRSSKFANKLEIWL